MEKSETINVKSNSLDRFKEIHSPDDSSKQKSAPESRCPFSGGKTADVPIVPMPPPGVSIASWMRGNLQKHPVFRAAGRGHRYYMTGKDARDLVNDRIADRKGRIPLPYSSDIDIRMIPEITRAMDCFLHDNAVEQLVPTIHSHMTGWLSKQVLDVQLGCFNSSLGYKLAG